MGIFSDIVGAVTGLSSSAASLIGGGISAAATLGGTLLTNQANANNTANAFNDNVQMADTTYQRTMADMQAAGLNPILAYSQQDPTATMGVPVVQNVVAQTANSGFDAANTVSSTDANNQSYDIKTPEQNAAQAVSSVTQPASATFSGAVGSAIDTAKNRWNDSVSNSAKDVHNTSSGLKIEAHPMHKDKEGRSRTDAQDGFNKTYLNMTR